MERLMSVNLTLSTVFMIMVKEMFHLTCVPPTLKPVPQLALVLVKLDTLFPITTIYTSEPVLTPSTLMSLKSKLKS
jgi:hypothetical protein